MLASCVVCRLFARRAWACIIIQNHTTTAVANGIPKKIIANIFDFHCPRVAVLGRTGIHALQQNRFSGDARCTFDVGHLKIYARAIAFMLGVQRTAHVCMVRILTMRSVIWPVCHRAIYAHCEFGGMWRDVEGAKKVKPPLVVVCVSALSCACVRTHDNRKITRRNYSRTCLLCQRKLHICTHILSRHLRLSRAIGYVCAGVVSLLAASAACAHLSEFNS